MTVNSLALRRGGLVNAVMRRANVLAGSGEVGQVWLEVLSPQPSLDSDVEALRKSGHLHPKVNARSVLRLLDPSATNSPRLGGPRPPLPEGHRLVSKPGTLEIMRDGVLQAVERRDAGGRLKYVDHYSSAAVRERRDEFDAYGRLSRMLDFTPTGRLGAERLIGQNGRAFLTMHYANGSPKWTRVYLGDDQVFLAGSVGEVYVAAFARALAEFSRPILFSEFRENLNNLPDLNLDAIAARVPHPNLRRVAVAHSNHHGSPYRRGAPVTRNWLTFLDSTDRWDELVVWTNQQREDLIAEFEPALPIRVIPQYAPPVRPTSREIDTTKVLLVSRLHPKKRVDEAIRVMRRVADKKPDSRLVIFGFSYGDKEETDVTRLVKDLDLDKHVVFAGFTSDPGEIYDDAAVTLTTSQSEGFSQVLLESFAHGVPVVAYECFYGPRDVIRHNVNGYLHEFGDVEAAADSVVRILTDPALRARFSAAARETVTEFSPERFERNWVRLCTEVASRQPRHVVTDLPAEPAEQSFQPRPRSGMGLVAALRKTVRWARERQRRR
jgi:poly(glycerol-phosphate) alpha-glucosyltransferase